MLAFPQRQRSDGFFREGLCECVNSDNLTERKTEKQKHSSWNLHATVVLEETSKQELNHNFLVEIYVKN